MRPCVKCSAVKVLLEYPKTPSCKDGHGRICKSCVSERKKQWKLKNSDRIKQQQVEYRSRPDVAAKLYASKVRWVSENKERERESRRRRRAKNREKENAALAVRRRNDPAFKIKAYARTRVYHLVSRGHKSAATIELLGASAEDVKRHIESKWLPGMSWDNHGKKGWHIDHIRPCASFDLTDPSQQRACFNYTNLQPLWWDVNLSKGDKWQGVAA